MEVPDGIEVRMVENTQDTIHFILPPEPSDELTDAQCDQGFAFAPKPGFQNTPPLSLDVPMHFDT